MANLKLDANYRSDMSKSHMKQIRRDGCVTASVFGREAEPVSVEINLKDLAEKVKGSEQGLMSLFDLKIQGGPKKSDGIVIIKEFHKDPMTRRVLDVQFQRVSMTEKLNVSVPIELIGEAAGIKEGGIIEQITNTLDIRTLPGNIPAKIEIDITGLAVGHHIRAQDIPLAAGTELVVDPETLICNCLPPHVSHEAEEEAAAEGEAVPTEGAAATTSTEG